MEAVLSASQNVRHRSDIFFSAVIQGVDTAELADDLTKTIDIVLADAGHALGNQPVIRDFIRVTIRL